MAKSEDFGEQVVKQVKKVKQKHPYKLKDPKKFKQFYDKLHKKVIRKKRDQEEEKKRKKAYTIIEKYLDK